MSERRTVTRLQGKAHDLQTSTRVITDDELKRELAYELATDLLRQMLEIGIISHDEFNKTDAKNREFFSPHLASLMPKITCTEGYIE